MSTQLQLDPTRNKTVWKNETKSNCIAYSANIQFVHDFLFLVMRTILPVVIIFIFSIFLIINVEESRRRANREKNRSDIFLTSAMIIINSFNVAFNVPTIVYYTYYCYLKLSKVSLTISDFWNFNNFSMVAYVLSSFLAVFQFWFDLALNRLFRELLLDSVSSKKPSIPVTQPIELRAMHTAPLI